MENYLITVDLVEVLAYKYGVTEVLTDRTLREKMNDMQERFLNAWKSVLPVTTNLRRVPASSLTELMGAVAERRMSETGALMRVGLDKIYDRNADFYLQLARETDPNNPENTTVMNRFGTASVEDQLRNLKREFDLLRSRRGAGRATPGRDPGIILTDVGSFSGESVSTIVGLLREYEIPVKGIVLGIASTEGARDLKKIHGNTAVDVVLQFAFYEWLELRDLFLIDGRKVPDRDNEGGIRRFIPYTTNITDWASVPQDKADQAVRICERFNSDLIGLLKGAGIDTRTRIGEPFSVAKKAKMTSGL
jgi:hypothetical protein